MLADAELQRAIIERLTTDAEMTQLINGRVFDYTPEQTALPYIVWQLGQSAEWDTTTENGFEVTFVLHVWSQYEGSLETNRIMQRIYKLLHEQYDFDLQLYRLINLRFTTQEVMRDPGGQTYHGMIRFRAILDSTETEAP